MSITDVQITQQFKIGDFHCYSHRLSMVLAKTDGSYFDTGDLMQ